MLRFRPRELRFRVLGCFVFDLSASLSSLGAAFSSFGVLVLSHFVITLVALCNKIAVTLCNNRLSHFVIN